MLLSASISTWRHYNLILSKTHPPFRYINSCTTNPSLTWNAQRTITTTKNKKNSDDINNANKTRLSKLISLYSHYSRRESEKLIRNGDVTVAGNIIQTPHVSYTMDEVKNAIKVAGKLLQTNQQRPQTRVWIAHKLPGEIVTQNDPHNRPSLMNRLYRSGLGKKKKTSHISPIGRLDMSTEGLILLTNDGEYKRQMELPSNRFHRTYRVRVHGNITNRKLYALRNGLVLNGVQYKPIQVKVEDVGKGANTWLTVTCMEGKNRLIRNLMEGLFLKVTRLIRTSFGDYRLDTIPPGMVIEVPVKKLDAQKHRGSLYPKKKRKPVAVDTVSAVKPPPVEWLKVV